MNYKRIALLLSCVLLLSGCGNREGQQDSGFTVSGGANRSMEENHLFTLSMRIPETLNPLRNREETVDRVLKLMFQPLIDFDESGKANPSVAESWAVSPDGKTISVKLRNDILWQNVKKLTADDVIFSLETIRGAEADSVYYNVLQYVTSCTKTGEYSVDFRFKEAFSGNLSVLRFPVISAEYYKGQTEKGSQTNLTPMGSGPYSLLSYTLATELALVANETFVGGVPTIERISVKLTAGEDTDIFGFEQGMTDILIGDAIRAGRYADERNSGVHVFNSNQYDFIGFNFRNPLFQDKSMRQAIAYAVPKKSLCDSVYLQYAHMTNTPISPKSWLYEENVAPYEYDATVAATFLKNNGWADNNGDGRLERAGENGEEALHLRILVNQENSSRRQIASKLKEELSLLGFGVTLESVSYAEYQDRFSNGDFDLVVGGWKMSEITDLTPFFATDGALNYIGYSDEEMDRLLQAAYSAVGEGKTLLAYSSLQKRIAEELPYISIAYGNDAVFTSNSVGGEIIPASDNVYRNINQWTYRSGEKE